MAGEAWRKGDEFDQYGPQWADYRRNAAAFKGGAGAEGQYYFRPGQTGAGSVMVGNAAGGRDVYDPAKHGAAPGFDDKRWSFEDTNGYGKSIGVDATKQANWTPAMRDQFTTNLGRTQPVRAGAPPATPGFAGVAPSGPAAPPGPAPQAGTGAALAVTQAPSGGFGAVKPIVPPGPPGRGLRTSFGQAGLH